MIKINLNDFENLDSILSNLKVGEKVLLSGTIITLRDAGHKRLLELIKNNEQLPYDLSNRFIYYAGPTDTPPGKIIGSIGPTTSARMDAFSYLYPSLKLKGSIGKGERDETTKRIYKENNLVYFVATGGCGALLSKSITSCKIVAFPDLGCESMKELEIKDFPVLVGLSAKGEDIYD